MADIQLIADLDASGVIRGQNQIKRSALDVAKATRSYTAETNRLNNDLRKGIITTSQYNQAIKELDADFRRWKTSLVDGSNQFARFNTAQLQATRGLKRFGSVGLQQVGYQVGDFAVQLQGGTNAAVALGQQGSQLLGIFGAGGAIAGAALAITTAFIAPLIKAKEEAENFEDKIKDLNDVFGDFVDLNERLQSIQGNESLIFTRLADAAERATEKLKEFKKEDFESSVKSFLDVFPNAGSQTQPVSGREIFDGRTQQAFREALDIDGSSREFRRNLTDIINSVESFKAASTFEEQVSALERMSEALGSVEQSDKVKELNEQIQALINTIADFDEAEKKLQGKDFGPGIKDIPSDAVAISKEYFDLVKDLETQIALSKVLIDNGKNSLELKKAELFIKRQELEYDLKVKGVSEDRVRTVLALYDVTTQQTLQIMEQERAAKAAEEAEKKRIKAQEERLRQLRKAWSDIDVDKVPGEGALEATANNVILAEQLRGQFESVSKEAKKLADAVLEAERNGTALQDVDMEVGVQAAKIAAEQLASYLRISLESAMAMVNLARGFGQTDAENNPVGASGNFEWGLLPTKEQLGIKEDKKSGSSTKDPLKELWEQVKLERLLLGETEARQRVIQALGLDYQKYGEVAISSIVAEIEELKRLQDEMDKVQAISDSLEDGFSDFFNSLVDGTKTVGDAFKDMARSILAQLWDILVTQQIVGSWSPESGGSGIVGGIMNFLKNANGNAFMNGQVVPFANGGIVNGPTLFPMANGMGLMGEAGPEAVMPLKRGKDGKLGVAAEGGKGDTYVINQNFNFSANGDESVRRIIAQAAPEISKITQRDILETRRRGGTFKAAFG